MDSFTEYVTEQLSAVDGLRAKRMFGGVGLHSAERFFGIIYEGRLYFKVDDSTRAKYDSAGMKPFQPPGKPAMKKYYEVPADVVEDSDALTLWALESAAIK